MRDCPSPGKGGRLVPQVSREGIERGILMQYAEALDSNARMRREKPKKNELSHIELKKADNGGVVAQHRMRNFDGKEPVHAFGADEGHKLAEHIGKHLGIHMPKPSDGDGTHGGTDVEQDEE